MEEHYLGVVSALPWPFSGHGHPLGFQLLNRGFYIMDIKGQAVQALSLFSMNLAMVPSGSVLMTNSSLAWPMGTKLVRSSPTASVMDISNGKISVYIFAALSTLFTATPIWPSVLFSCALPI